MVLTLVSFTQDAASELLYPLLPLLLTGVLAAPPVVLGLVEGLAEATAGVTRYVTGRWSDRRGRRPFIGAGYTLAAIGKALVAAAGVWPVVLLGRVVDRFGKGVRSAPRDALIASSVTPEARGRAFGFHRAGDSAGAVVGPLLGLWALSAMDDDLHAALWWAVVPATISALLVIFVREPPLVIPTPLTEPAPPAGPQPHATSAPSGALPASSAPSTSVVLPASSALSAGKVHADGLPRPFWLVTGVLVAVGVVNFSDTLVLLRVMNLGFSTTEVVLAYVLFNTVYTLGSYPAGALSDQWPRPYVYAAGLAAFGIGYLGLGLVDGGSAVYLLVAVYGLFPAFTDGVGKAWIASLVPPAHAGRAQGIYQGLNSGAVLVAGIWAGLLWSAGPGDGRVPLTISGVCGLTVAIAMIAGRRFRRGRTRTRRVVLLASDGPAG